MTEVRCPSLIDASCGMKHNDRSSRSPTLQAAVFKRTRERPKPPIEVDPAVPQMLSDITVK